MGKREISSFHVQTVNAKIGGKIMITWYFLPLPFGVNVVTG